MAKRKALGKDIFNKKGVNNLIQNTRATEQDQTFKHTFHLPEDISFRLKESCLYQRKSQKAVIMEALDLYFKKYPIKK